MTNPIAFSSATPGLGLPLLIAGQAQKEFFVNRALTILDALYPRAVVASQPNPPASAAEGDSFRVTSPAGQAWVGCEDHIAVRIGGDWHFIAPRSGLRLFDRTADVSLFYRTDWVVVAPTETPTGGTVIDSEARAAIGSLIAALRDAGIFVASAS